ncbi:hypothetical protein [Streptomyces sp. JJ36]|uniref:hypothetical protein n=1 Tax=Streptomyces sp. JJ36 TaxID=2736645 RepID=UPI001F24CFCB|nr:hypothetical protein [Streptomyces sp. JJ36]
MTRATRAYPAAPAPLAGAPHLHGTRRTPRTAVVSAARGRAGSRPDAGRVPVTAGRGDRADSSP